MPAVLAKPTAPPEPLLTKRQVADVLSLSPRTVERMIERGELPVTRVGTRCRFRPEDVRRYIESSREVPAKAAQ